MTKVLTVVEQVAEKIVAEDLRLSEKHELFKELKLTYDQRREVNELITELEYLQ